jgi:diacylglycerol kinase family enzyme
MTTRSAFVVQDDGTLAVYQHADDIFDYVLDFTDLLAGGDTIATSVWAGQGVEIVAPLQDGATASAFVAGTSGIVSHTVTTAAGRRKRTEFAVLPLPAVTLPA